MVLSFPIMRISIVIVMVILLLNVILTPIYFKKGFETLKKVMSYCNIFAFLVALVLLLQIILGAF